MVTLDVKTLTVPVGIVRILEVIFTCITFSLVASVGSSSLSFWTWCMFTWCFCFCVTLLILILEFTSLSAKLPISWDDFTCAFAMLATLMVLEAFVACIIFICLDENRYKMFPGLQWCVAVYSICFIFAVTVIIFTICRLLSLFPAPFDKVLTGCNVLAVLMYITAVVIWPLYSFQNNPKPSNCPSYGLGGIFCKWNHLVASVGYDGSSYWAWCMFTWCFCFFFTFLILILEFSTVSAKLPFAWEDFTTAFAMLATLMCLTTSIIYPTFFTCSSCHRAIGASVVSWVCFGVYAGEVVLTRLRPRGETIGFLSTLPGIMKMLETFIACLIYTSLEPNQFHTPGLRWCVAVYCLCFIFAIFIILLSLGQLASFFPLPFDKEKLVVVTFMTIFNWIVYTLDSAYSIRLVFCVRDQ
ncbi:Myeloid-associated differentiation marker [Collichthys lucidus]|uniref:Myeloid-associated differentiation marker n=1 Tax=Collichthys lucidus TaxID=240159 RepID=A0A4U5VT49_COLLU|nr:Myeloid-associated differentiation marker [Collichthys lucidus]